MLERQELSDGSLEMRERGIFLAAHWANAQGAKTGQNQGRKKLLGLIVCIKVGVFFSLNNIPK